EHASQKPRRLSNLSPSTQSPSRNGSTDMSQFNIPTQFKYVLGIISPLQATTPGENYDAEPVSTRVAAPDPSDVEQLSSSLESHASHVLTPVPCLMLGSQRNARVSSTSGTAPFLETRTNSALTSTATLLLYQRGYHV